MSTTSNPSLCILLCNWRPVRKVASCSSIAEENSVETWLPLSLCTEMLNQAKAAAGEGGGANRLSRTRIWCQKSEREWLRVDLYPASSSDPRSFPYVFPPRLKFPNLTMARTGLGEIDLDIDTPFRVHLKVINKYAAMYSRILNCACSCQVVIQTQVQGKGMTAGLLPIDNDKSIQRASCMSVLLCPDHTGRCHFLAASASMASYNAPIC